MTHPLKKLLDSGDGDTDERNGGVLFDINNDKDDWLLNELLEVFLREKKIQVGILKWLDEADIRDGETKMRKRDGYLWWCIHYFLNPY